MRSVGVYEAKSQLTKLLAQVEAGEQIAITRHGTPIAKLVPFADQRKPSPREVMEEIRRIRDDLRRKGVSISHEEIRAFIAEGRR
jgi:prevent-host-death family protein